jgi:hypothetical protein
MKKWSLRIILLAVLAGLGFWGWRVLFPSPEQVIRKLLVEVSRTASFPANEGALARVANAQALTSYCNPDVEITVDVPGYSRRTFNGIAEVLQAVVLARSTGRTFNVEFLDIIVTLAPDRNSAVANLTAKGTLSGANDIYIQELRFDLRKVQGKWLIFRAETVNTLSPR